VGASDPVYGAQVQTWSLTPHMAEAEPAIEWIEQSGRRRRAWQDRLIDATRISSGAAAIAGSIEPGAFPREIQVTADQRTMLVTNFASKTLELIDIQRLPK
jgi:hypothetical protein